MSELKKEMTMEQRDVNNVNIGIGMVWFFMLSSLLLTLVGAVVKVQHWDYHEIFLTIGLMLFFSTWIIIFSDIFKNNVYNKTFWILSMFIMPFVAVFFYLIQRNKLLRLGKKFS